MSSITLPSSLKKKMNSYNKLKALSKEEALRNIDELKEDLGLKNFKTDEKKLKIILKKTGSLCNASIKTRTEERKK